MSQKPATDKPAKTLNEQERFTLPLTKDGSRIDWASIRPNRRDSLRKVLDASIDRPAGAPAAPGAAPAPLLDSAMVGALYDVLVQVEALAARRMFGCSTEEAVRVLSFSKAEKDALAGPTVKVLNKYLPASLLDKYADEVMLLLLLTTMTRGKFDTLRGQLAARRPRAVTSIQQGVATHTSPAEVKTETHKIPPENMPK